MHKDACACRRDCSGFSRPDGQHCSDANNNNADAMNSDAMDTRKTLCKTSLLNEHMLEQLNGMSLTERRLPATPRITLTSVDDDEPPRRGDAMADAMAPNFLAVPKLLEVGKERRPPAMVKSV